MKKLQRLEVSCSGWGCDVVEIAKDIISRIDYNKVHNYDDLIVAIFKAIDDGLINYWQKWAIIEEYCTPETADYNEAYEQFTEDLFSSLTIEWNNEDEDGEA